MHNVKLYNPIKDFISLINDQHPLISRKGESIGQISLWQLFEKTKEKEDELFVVGSQVFPFLGYDNVIQIIAEKHPKMITIIPFQNFIRFRCAQFKQDVDFRVKKVFNHNRSHSSNMNQYLSGHLRTIDQCLAAHSNDLYKDANWFEKNFYINRLKPKNHQWAMVSFHYGNQSVDWLLEVFLKRSFIFYESSLKLKIIECKGSFKVKLMVDHQLDPLDCLLEHMNGLIRIPLNSIREEKDLEMLIARETHFMHTQSPFEETEIFNFFIKKSKNVTQGMFEVIKECFEKHSNHSISALVAITMNALRICEKVVLTHLLQKQVLQIFCDPSKSRTWSDVIFDMLKSNIDHKCIGAFLQCLAQIEPVQLRAVLLFHHNSQHLQIGITHSILVPWDLQNAIELIFNQLELFEPYFKQIVVLYSCKIPFYELWHQYLYFKNRGELALQMHLDALMIDDILSPREKFMFSMRLIELYPQALPISKRLLLSLQDSTANKKFFTQQMQNQNFSIQKYFFKHQDCHIIYKKALQLRLIPIDRELNAIWFTLFQIKQSELLLKDLYQFWKEEYEFHRKYSLNLAAIDDMAVYLFDELKKHPSTESLAKELYDLFKKKPAIQNKMQIIQENMIQETRISEISEKTEPSDQPIVKIDDITQCSFLIENQNWNEAIFLLNQILQQKKCKSKLLTLDTSLAQLLGDQESMAFKYMNWQKFSLYLKDLKKSSRAFDYRLSFWTKQIQMEEDLEWFNYSSKPKFYLFESAIHLKNTSQFALSESAYKKFFIHKSQEKMKSASALPSLILAYQNYHPYGWKFGIETISGFFKVFNFLRTSKEENSSKAFQLAFEVILSGPISEPQVIPLIENLIKLNYWTNISAKIFLELFMKGISLIKWNQQLTNKVVLILPYLSNYLVNPNDLLIVLFFYFNSIKLAKEDTAPYDIIRSIVEKNQKTPLSKENWLLFQQKLIDFLQIETETHEQQIKVHAWNLITKPWFLNIFPIDHHAFCDFFCSSSTIVLLLKMPIDAQAKVSAWINFFERICSRIEHMSLNINETHPFKDLISETLFSLFLFQMLAKPLHRDTMVIPSEYKICKNIYFKSKLADPVFFVSSMIKQTVKFFKIFTQNNHFDQKKISTLSLALCALLRSLYENIINLLETSSSKTLSIHLMCEWSRAQFYLRAESGLYLLNEFLGKLKKANLFDSSDSKTILLALIGRAIRKNQAEPTRVYPRFLDQQPFIDHESEFLQQIDKKTVGLANLELIQLLFSMHSAFAAEFVYSVIHYGMDTLVLCDEWHKILNECWAVDLTQYDLGILLHLVEKRFWVGCRSAICFQDNSLAVESANQIVIESIQKMTDFMTIYKGKWDPKWILDLQERIDVFNNLFSFNLKNVNINDSQVRYEHFLKLLDVYFDLALISYSVMRKNKMKKVMTQHELANLFKGYLLNFPEQYQEIKKQLIKNWEKKTK